MTPFVLVPGLASDEAVWRPVVERLADIVSCHVAETRLDDSIAAITTRILAAAPARFALAGVSMGGYVALELVRQAPDRVTRLALLDTSARPDTTEQSAGRRSAIAALDRAPLDVLGRHRPPDAGCGRRARRLTPPALAKELAAAIPRATLHIIPGSGHLPPIEKPEETAALLRAWLH